MTGTVAWLPIYQTWLPEGDKITFQGDPERFGLALTNQTIRDGSVEITVTIGTPPETGLQTDFLADTNSTGSRLQPVPQGAKI